MRTNETWCVLSTTQCAIVCGEWGNSISWSTPEQSDLWKLMFQVCPQLLARQGNSPLYITARKWVHIHYTAVVEVHMHVHLVASCDFRPNVWMYGLETTKDLISGLGLFMLFSEVTNSWVLKLINLLLKNHLSWSYNKSKADWSWSVHSRILWWGLLQTTHSLRAN